MTPDPNHYIVMEKGRHLGLPLDGHRRDGVLAEYALAVERGDCVGVFKLVEVEVVVTETVKTYGIKE